MSIIMNNLVQKKTQKNELFLNATAVYRKDNNYSVIIESDSYDIPNILGHHCTFLGYPTHYHTKHKISIWGAKQ